MTSWREFEAEAPELAAAVRARFESAKHHVLATLRADGSPRVSGTEVEFAGGELTTGSMAGALKARDLRRDPRFALHAHPGDGSMSGGDAKVAGRAVLTADADEAAGRGEGEGEGEGDPADAFRLELTEVVLTSVAETQDHLVIQTWHAGGGPVRVIRRD